METVEGIGEAEGAVYKASHVYLLMSKEYRISRNRRAEWFFSHLNATVKIKQKYKLVRIGDEIVQISWCSSRERERFELFFDL